MPYLLNNKKEDYKFKNQQIEVNLTALLAAY